jgi:hypothetical protein
MPSFFMLGRGLPWRPFSCLVAGLAAVGSALACRTVAAEPAAWSREPPPRLIEDRFRVELGAFFASVDTRLRVDPTPAVAGTSFAAENDLGLAKSKVLPQFELTLLPGKRHLIRLSALPLRRSGAATLDRTLVIQNNTYVPGQSVATQLDLNLFGLTYGYRIMRRDNAELAATLGVQVGDVSSEIVARNPSRRQTDGSVVPLPLVGLEGRWDFSTRWSVEGRVQYLRAHASDVQGSVLDARLAATWRANPHLLIGLGYRKFRVDIDSKDTGTPGKLNFQLKGPELYLRASL